MAIWQASPAGAQVGGSLGGAGSSAGLLGHVASDLRYAFRQPRMSLGGLGLNLVLALLYLIIDPLTNQPHQDLALLVGSYFAVFLLADVTTTNALGADAERVRRSLSRGTPLGHILLAKNLLLMLTAGLPILVVTALITVDSESSYRLALTLSGVLLPILAWFGVGNLVSVALPVAAASWRERWRQRRDRRSTARWLAALLVPYALCFVVDPLSAIPLLVPDLSATGSLALASALLTATGLAIYSIGTAAALGLASRRSLRLGDPAAA